MESKIEFVLFDERLKKEYGDRIYKILYDSDKEFFPPLSERVSTTQSDLKAQGKSGGIDNYFNAMMAQDGLGIFIDGTLCGYISFIRNYVNEEINGLSYPNIYVSTLVLTAFCRGKGVTKRAYDYLFNEQFANNSVYTRTWSTNYAHIKILKDFNFSEILIKKDDRGDGVDTVYFGLRR